ncbi:MAG TPA: hypothetical protein DDZ81_11095 [Acetobacteraceae bacterium]|jgi:hypothetical protein|nr:hypothetical protein [Acetobacteraceae bacterium]
MPDIVDFGAVRAAAKPPAQPVRQAPHGPNTDTALLDLVVKLSGLAHTLGVQLAAVEATVKVQAAQIEILQTGFRMLASKHRTDAGENHVG